MASGLRSLKTAQGGGDREGAVVNRESEVSFLFVFVGYLDFLFLGA